MKCWDWHVHVHTCRLKCRKRWHGSTFKAVQKMLSYTALLYLNQIWAKSKSGCSSNCKHTTVIHTFFTPIHTILLAHFGHLQHWYTSTSRLKQVYYCVESNNSISHSLFPTFNATIERYPWEWIIVLLFIFSCFLYRSSVFFHSSRCGNCFFRRDWA